MKKSKLFLHTFKKKCIPLLTPVLLYKKGGMGRTFDGRCYPEFKNNAHSN